jgi:hypothetical protein
MPRQVIKIDEMDEDSRHDTFITLRMTIQEALRRGLLICKCGHRDNNHFTFEKGPCAHCDECKELTLVPVNAISFVGE